MCDHGPTHVDALSHLDPRPEAPSIEKMSLKLFYGDASCIDVSHKEPRASINAADIDGAIARSGVDVRKGDILLFYTGIRWVPRDKGVSQPVSWFRRIRQYVAGRKGDQDFRCGFSQPRQSRQSYVSMPHDVSQIRHYAL